MAQYSVNLTFQSPDPTTFQGREVFRLVCNAASPINMPAEIFAHEKTLVDPLTGRQQDEFSFICSPYELSIYPADTPDPTQSPQYFRKSAIDILLPSVTMFAEVKQEIKDQVARLVGLLSSLDDLNTTETVTISDGTATPESSESSTESSSSSDSSLSE